MRQNNRFNSLKNRLLQPLLRKVGPPGYEIRREALNRLQDKSEALEQVKNLLDTKGLPELGMRAEVLKILEKNELRTLGQFLADSQKEFLYVEEELLRLQTMIKSAKRWPSFLWRMFTLGNLKKKILNLSRSRIDEDLSTQSAAESLLGRDRSGISMKHPGVALGLLGAKASQDYLTLKKLRDKIRKLQNKFTFLDQELLKLDEVKRVWWKWALAQHQSPTLVKSRFASPDETIDEIVWRTQAKLHTAKSEIYKIKRRMSFSENHFPREYEKLLKDSQAIQPKQVNHVESLGQ